MICKPCAEIADARSGDNHLIECKGCDCQHKPVKAGQIEKGNS